MKTGAQLQAEVATRLEIPSPELDGEYWDPSGTDGPLYTGMVEENTDPFVPAGALKVSIAEAQRWEPPAGCVCTYSEAGRGGKAPCNADHGTAS